MPIYPRFIPQYKTIKIDDRVIDVSLLSVKPPVVVFDNLFSKEEALSIINSGGSLRNSNVQDDNNSSGSKSTHRTGQLKELAYGENDVVSDIEKRIALLTGTEVYHGEPFQVIHYSTNERYLEHQDYFPPSSKVAQLDTWGNRYATFILYLNDDLEGGETVFPKLDLSVEPKVGRAVYFEYMDKKGVMTGDCLHAGSKVTSGDKWIATKWMREHPNPPWFLR